MNEHELVDSITNYVKEGEAGYEAAAENASKAIFEVANFMAENLGLTGFQASYAMVKALKNFSYPSSCGIRIVDYDDFLYPQYEEKLTSISASTWEVLQKEARRLLVENRENAAAPVVAHWQSVADGKVPFGYKVN